MVQRPQGRYTSPNVVCGDYLQVSATRSAAAGRGIDAGFARVERVEHLPAEHAGVVFADRFFDFGPTPVVWCHGLPGPLLLPGGDVPVLEVASPRRAEHETHHPWWTDTGAMPLLRGARPAGAAPLPTRREHDWNVDAIAWPEPAESDRYPQRPTTFTKPAGALLSGDYLGVHPGRWPTTDRDIDEGFVRVEHLHLLDPAAAIAVFADPSWHTDIVVASLHGIDNVLLLRSSDAVDVLAFVNPERDAWERREPWNSEPIFVLHGSREPTEHDVRIAAETDNADRPDVDESALYPSEFDDPFTRRMVLESAYGFRSVPLSALPWPHHQADCPLGELAEHYRDRVPDTHGAHAAAFLSRPGRTIRATCPYHQPDWPRLVRILDETAAAATDERPQVAAHPEYEQLSAAEQAWLDFLVHDPIKYDDGSTALTNGQHRLCALRAAGITHCPVKGTYLPDTDHGPGRAADVDARNEITASWQRLAADNALPAWTATVAPFLPPAWRRLLIENNPARPRRGRR